jgi:DNA-binding XRE family transcriptional regulator
MAKNSAEVIAITRTERRLRASNKLRESTAVISTLQRKLGERFRVARIQRAYTQEEVAEDVGSHKTTINRIEKGDWALNMTLRRYLKICQHLDKDPADMLRGIRLDR